MVTIASVPSGISATLLSLCRSHTWSALCSPATSVPLLWIHVTDSELERPLPALLGLMPESSTDHEVTQLGVRTPGSAKSVQTLRGESESESIKLGRVRSLEN